MSNWIKMSVGLRTHPKVVRMASALKADRLRVIGGLHAVWSIFDAHTEDGILVGYTLRAMDDDLGWKGFSAAMRDVEWLEETEEGLRVPEYTEHNGATAKRRAMETSRKGRGRKSGGNGSGDKSAPKAPDSPQASVKESGQMSASDADKVRNRIDKRREELLPSLRSGSSGRASSRASAIPPDFGISDQIREWAKREGFDSRLEAHLEHFRDYAVAKGAKYADWDAAFRNAIRSDWGDIRKNANGSGPRGVDAIAGAMKLVAEREARDAARKAEEEARAPH